jgi:hypothetical protein
MAERRIVPFEEGYFTVPDDPATPPRLIGTRCRACGEHFYPRRVICAKCLSDQTEEAQLGPRGKLYTYTFLHSPGFGEYKAGVKGYPAGQVDLAEGPRIQAVLLAEPGELRIGMEMELTLATVATDKEGREVVMYRFRPLA